MRATSRRVTGKLKQHVAVREHRLTADEPPSHGGEDSGPSPQELLAASLASCTAITMEMYAKRKGWDVAGLRVDVEYTPAERGCMTRFDLVMHMPAHLSDAWDWDFHSFHSPEWWRNHWAKLGKVEVEHADLLPEGWRHWLRWEQLGSVIADEKWREQCAGWARNLEADAGRTLGFARVVARKPEAS